MTYDVCRLIIVIPTRAYTRAHARTRAHTILVQYVCNPFSGRVTLHTKQATDKKSIFSSNRHGLSAGISGDVTSLISDWNAVSFNNWFRSSSISTCLVIKCFSPFLQSFSTTAWVLPSAPRGNHVVMIPNCQWFLLTLSCIITTSLIFIHWILLVPLICELRSSTKYSYFHLVQ